MVVPQHHNVLAWVLWKHCHFEHMICLLTAVVLHVVVTLSCLQEHHCLNLRLLATAVPLMEGPKTCMHHNTHQSTMARHLHVTVSQRFGDP
jgi:hypothetical protein